MTTKISQSAFTNGELTPALHARVDLDQYQRGLATCLNAIIHPHGGASNRAGTEFVIEVKDSTKAVRLIEFQFNTSDTYALEFGDQYMRVIRNGVQVESGGSPYEISTPYLEAELFDIKFVQSADIITITHPNHAPRELSRASHTSWTLSTITFAPSISAPTGLASSAPGAGNTYVVTAIAEESYEESLASASANSTSRTSTLSWTAVTGAIEYNVYLLSNGLYYYIGKAGTNSFTDSTLPLDYTQTPPTARNPFNASGDYPATVGYHNQRLCFGSTNNNPQKLWMSKTGLFHNMTASSPLKDDDAITLTIDSNQVNAIRHIVPLTDLSIMTSGTEAVITSNDNAFTFANLRRKIQSYYGASNVAPVVAGKSAIFIQEDGNVVREISYDDGGNFAGSDRSIFSEHLFTGYSIVDMGYAKSPDSIVWAVRNDGVLLGLTYLLEQNVFAWHKHTTDGLFESVCTIPENNESATYFVVKRKINGTWKRYIERLHSRQFTDVKDCFFVDSGLSLDVPVTISGATQANPVVITATGHPFSNGDLIDHQDIVGMTELNGNRYAIANVTANTYELTDVDTGDNIDGTAFTAYESGGEAREAVTAISGLTHLEGETVSILADGSVVASQVVSSGAITLSNPASKVHIGLPYTTDIETLKPPSKKVSGRKVSASSLTCQVHKSRGMFAGPDADNLFELKQTPTAYDSPIALFTGEVEIAVTSAWQNGGKVLIRQTDPLPLTILSIIPDILIGN